jgi:DNA-binding NtrC family response regulator
LPPLRQRQDDVVLLARHFAAQTERRYGLEKREFSEDALSALKSYPWPGNVRELRHQVSRAVLLSRDELITAADVVLPLPAEASQAGHQDGLVMAEHLTLDSAEKILIENALRLSGNNVSEAARYLSITRMAMRYRMEKHGIKPN